MSSSTITRILVDPASGVPIGEVADTSLADLDRVVARSATAQRTWATALPRSARWRCSDWRISSRLKPTASSRLEVAETGKPWAVMRDGELPFAVDNLRFFAAAARSLDGTRGRRRSATATRRCCCAGPLGWWPRSRRGTSRW